MQERGDGSGEQSYARSMKPTIIVLNGIGSVGKSSTAKALQRMASDHFLHVQGDMFLEMISPKMWGHKDGIMFTQRETEGRKSVEIKMGPEVDRLMNGMRASVAALANTGNNCIVDDVMLTRANQDSYLAAQMQGTLYFVGLHAPVGVLEQRERDRGDRLEGLARWQRDRVHQGIRYDFEIDTSQNTPDECALAIAKALGIPTNA